jgi:hypothetical protein
MLRSLFFPRPGEDTEALNAGSPAGDAATFGEAVRRTAAHVARLSRIPRPDEHPATVAAAFLPDVLRYRPGQPAASRPARVTAAACTTTRSELRCRCWSAANSA